MFIELEGIGGHKVLINVEHIRDVRHWPGPTATAVITDKDIYLVNETVNQIKALLEDFMLSA